MQQQNYSVGIYVRLSKDDERAGESVSIENQKLMLRKYVTEQGWDEVGCYVDDGFSGTNLERPGIQRLLEDAKDGRVNLILVKDMSRLGRNYIEVGRLTDYVFPMIGCRFIALNDGVDSIHSDNDIAPFRNLFNEFQSRDNTKEKRQSYGLHIQENHRHPGGERRPVRRLCRLRAWLTCARA